ncbi:MULTISPECIES: glutamyl-tRNA reductase [Kitasatospora]|uniref:Glutamyl-tRNA reductase n=1 Tax=Kitasatospora setae (strain ATCC 33774 / DSM 43861 / JCM 3304 / KCC A-0304 / NBRC 14216 / KM-6054) TaxID=452652 RepID=E4ND91_KITSK|nr:MULTISPECIES: glutamyl-tRNA reductase [Kitasatospora]BAJ29172.1 putative glutamyl-tRNA reductase [Kitasatospora setae KM-6054]
MSLLVVGLSHRTAPVGVLERAALTGQTPTRLLHDAAASATVGEAALVNTCNRIELYADVDKFHAGVAELSQLLAGHSGVDLDELTPHLYVHYEDRAVHHLFSVACGLDSMVVGEGQILGQLRDALARAQEEHTAGRGLNELFQQALRVGKRAHSETGIDKAGQSLVTFGLEQVAAGAGPIAGKRALVVGAGSMSSLAAATLARAGVTDLLVANRTPARAERLVEILGGAARVLDFAKVPQALADVDLVISCTGAAGTVIDAPAVAAALASRTAARPLAFLDLAMPRDVDHTVRDLDGALLVDLETLSHAHAATPGAGDVDAVSGIVADEVTAFGQAQRAARIAPTVVALRAMASEVVSGELARLTSRLPDLDERSRAEISQTVRRVVDKLLHAPTVKVKQLAAEPGGASYAEALRELFDLDPAAVHAVSGTPIGAQAGSSIPPGGVPAAQAALAPPAGASAPPAGATR